MASYDTPLRWEHEDGRTGTEVSEIPHEGRVFFYDEAGPVARFDDIEEARWWCMVKTSTSDGRETRFRATRLKVGGHYHFLMNGGIAMDCDGTGEHSKCTFPCVPFDAFCNRLHALGAV